MLRHCGLEQRGAADADDAAPSAEQPCCLGNCGVMEQSCCGVIGWQGVVLEVGGAKRDRRVVTEDYPTVCPKSLNYQEK